MYGFGAFYETDEMGITRKAQRDVNGEMWMDGNGDHAWQGSREFR